MKTEEIFNQIDDFYKISTMNNALEYLKTLLINYKKLNKSKQDIYILNLKDLYLDNNNIEDFIDKHGYRIIKGKKAIQNLIANQFLMLTTKDFENVIIEIILFLSQFEKSKKTAIISKEEITTIFDVICKKFPNFNNILKNINIDILILDNSNTYHNSITIPNGYYNFFKILCFYMKDNDEYKSGQLNPIYVFIHEIGHIINWYVTKENRIVPSSFFEEVGKYYPTLTPDNPDALEVFADSFAMAIMYNTDLSKYNPFSSLHEELFKKLEIYFKNII